MIFKHLFAVLLIFFIIFSITPIQSVASEYGTPQFPKKQNKQGRLLYAKELSLFFKKIDEFIPSLSPSQKEWLDEEYKEYEKNKNISRYWTITNTKEYRINILKDDIKLKISLLDLILKSEKLQNEMYLWSLISECLLKVSFWSELYILIENDRLIDKKLFYSDLSKKVDQYYFYLNNGTIQGIQIMKNIIQPYLRGEISK